MAAQALAGQVEALNNVRTIIAQGNMTAEAFGQEVVKAIDVIGFALESIKGSISEQEANFANVKAYAMQQDDKIITLAGELAGIKQQQ